MSADICPKCKGTGIANYFDVNVGIMVYQPSPYRCTACDGTGYVKKEGVVE